MTVVTKNEMSISLHFVCNYMLIFPCVVSYFAILILYRMYFLARQKVLQLENFLNSLNVDYISKLLISRLRNSFQYSFSNFVDYLILLLL